MTATKSSVQTHYGADDLVDRIMGALKSAGHDTANPTVEMLNLIDQLHGGGLNGTKAQAELVRVTGDMRVLDAGCGVGGSSRYLIRRSVRAGGPVGSGSRHAIADLKA